jgi:hypothetical protein
MAAAAGQKQPADAVAPRLGREPNAPSNHWRAPDPIPSEASRGQSAVFVIRRGANGKATRYRLPLQATVTEAIAVLVGTMVPVRTDLSGALQGWWRLCRNGALLPPETRLEALDPETPLDLGFIDNHPLPVELEVKGPQFTMTVRTVVGTAIPAVALVDAAAHMFNLPEGDWRLSVSGRRLGTHDILADHPLEGVARIVLEKA